MTMPPAIQNKDNQPQAASSATGLDGPSLLGQATASATGPAFHPERELIHRQMLSSVSHDLKTPLVSVIGSLEVLERMKDILPEDKKTALIQVALQEAYRLDHFINNILDMAKLENKLVKPKKEQAEIGGILRNCSIKVDSLLRDGKINIQKQGNVEVATDTVLLSRVIGLILDNAIRYGDKPAIIYVNYGMDNNVAFIEVRDNGKGIPTAQNDAIFSKYTRFAKQDQKNAGTGLGLAISREIMTLLGGSITSTNHAEGGAVFTLRLPII